VTNLGPSVWAGLAQVFSGGVSDRPSAPAHEPVYRAVQ
jgi:hypothetical protein